MLMLLAVRLTMVCSLLCFLNYESFMVGVLRQNATKCNRGRLCKLINNNIHESWNLNMHTSLYDVADKRCRSRVMRRLCGINKWTKQEYIFFIFSISCFPHWFLRFDWRSFDYIISLWLLLYSGSAGADLRISAFNCLSQSAQSRVVLITARDWNPHLFSLFVWNCGVEIHVDVVQTHERAWSKTGSHLHQT